MPKFNRNFELTISDVEAIEIALQRHKATLSLDRMAIMNGDAPSDENYKTLDEIETALNQMHDLLGRLHNQKIFFRPATVDDLPYVGG